MLDIIERYAKKHNNIKEKTRVTDIAKLKWTWAGHLRRKYHKKQTAGLIY